MEVKDQITEALKSIQSDLEKKTSEQIKAAQDKAVDEVKKLTGEIAELRTDKETMQKHLDELTTRQKDIKIGGDRNKSFGDLLEDGMLAKKDELSHLKTNKSAKVDSFEVKLFDRTKAAASMLISTNYSGGTYGLTSFEPGLQDVPRRQPFLRQLVTTRPVSGMYVAWAEKANRDGAANVVAEGAAKPLIDFDVVEATKKVEKIAAVLKTSKENLDDVAYMRSEIQTELIDAIELVLDTQLLSGSGTTPNLKGILTYAPTLSVAGSPFALGVDLANNMDVIRAAAWKIQSLFFQPNVVVLNPADAAMFDVLKIASTGVYIVPPFATASGQTIAGLRVVANAAMTQGNFLVGDFSKDVLGIREEININIGYENDDFTKNLVTFVAEMRAVNYIKANNVNAFVQGTFSTLKTAMETP
jgi:HK97 family phage major capsid protein